MALEILTKNELLSVVLISAASVLVAFGYILYRFFREIKSDIEKNDREHFI